MPEGFIHAKPLGSALTQANYGWLTGRGLISALALPVWDHSLVHWPVVLWWLSQLILLCFWSFPAFPTTSFSGHVWGHRPPVLPLSSMWSQQGQTGTGACPGAAGKGEATLGAGAGSCLTPFQKGQSPTPLPGWAGLAGGEALVRRQKFSFPLLWKHLSQQIALIQRLWKCPPPPHGDWAGCRGVVWVHQETLCNHVSICVILSSSPVHPKTTHPLPFSGCLLNHQRRQILSQHLHPVGTSAASLELMEGVWAWPVKELVL